MSKQRLIFLLLSLMIILHIYGQNHNISSITKIAQILDSGSQPEIRNTLIDLRNHADSCIADYLIALLEKKPTFEYVELVVDIFVNNNFDNKNELRAILNKLLLPNSPATIEGFGPVYLGYKPINYPDERKSIYPSIVKLGVDYFKTNLYLYYLEEKDTFPYYASATINLLEHCKSTDKINEYRSHYLERLNKGVIIFSDTISVDYDSLLSEYTFRLSLARLLYRYGVKIGRDLLIEGCNNSYWITSRLAAETFEIYGIKEDIPVLISLLDSQDWAIRKSACCGLQRITGINIKNRSDGSCFDTDSQAWKDWYYKNSKK